jgi:hypothetical protein
MYSPDDEIRPAMAFDRVTNLELFSVKAEVKTQSTPMIHFRNVTNVTTNFCRSIGGNNMLIEAEENTCENLYLSGNILQTGQKEIVKVAALPDEQFFEDFQTELKYSVEKGENINGLIAQDLRESPLKFNIEITKRGSLQLCLLILNSSLKPEKVYIKYEGITQEFTINWNNWGWAPITLLKEYSTNQKIDFEIFATVKNTELKVSKVYFRYQDVKKTD